MAQQCPLMTPWSGCAHTTRHLAATWQQGQSHGRCLDAVVGSHQRLQPQRKCPRGAAGCGPRSSARARRGRQRCRLRSRQPLLARRSASPTKRSAATLRSAACPPPGAARPLPGALRQGVLRQGAPPLPALARGPAARLARLRTRLLLRPDGGREAQSCQVLGREGQARGRGRGRCSRGRGDGSGAARSSARARGRPSSAL